MTQDFEGAAAPQSGPRQGQQTPIPTTPPEERAVLVGVQLPGSEWRVEDSLDELEQLAATAGVRAVGRGVQRLEAPNPRTFVGRGKLEEIADLLPSLALFDDELSPGQERHLEDRLNCKVVDRTGLILDIFARRAHTHEGRLQVELAQLEYRLPRLTRMWTHLSRQGVGGVGLRGPGETQLEVDRRKARDRIAHIKGEIEQVRRRRHLLREQRRQGGYPVVALVGYTNAGKSTLLNKLAGASVLTEDKLFATLDPTTRQVRLPGGTVALWTDTVGFIQKLPTGLVAAFRATLEEIVEADVLVHVVDVTHENAQEQARIVEETLGSLGVADKPVVVALNKVDLLAPEDVPALPDLDGDVPEDYVLISAERGWGLEELRRRVESIVAGDLVELSVTVPYSESSLVDLFHHRGQVRREEYTERGTRIEGRIPLRYRRLFEAYGGAIG